MSQMGSKIDFDTCHSAKIDMRQARQPKGYRMRFTGRKSPPLYFNQL
jgi:hypothetical protein